MSVPARPLLSDWQPPNSLAVCDQLVCRCVAQAWAGLVSLHHSRSMAGQQQSPLNTFQTCIAVSQLAMAVQDFNPAFSFDVGDLEGPAQVPWEFGGQYINSSTAGFLLPAEGYCRFKRSTQVPSSLHKLEHCIVSVQVHSRWRSRTTRTAAQ